MLITVNNNISIQFLNSSSSTAAIEGQSVNYSNWLVAIDYTSRLLCLFTHLLYFLTLLLNKELHERSMLHKHHTNLTGLLIGLYYCAWIGSSSPKTGNKIMNNTVCALAEAFWAVIKYARGYSYLALIMTRFLAVFRSNLFNKLISSNLKTFLSILSVWLASIFLFCVAKFATGTFPNSQMMCNDGYSLNPQSRIVYFVISSLIGFLVPMVLINFIYVCISRKLQKIEDKLHIQNQNNQNHTVNNRSHNKETNISFLISSVLLFGSFVFLMLLNLENMVVVFTKQTYWIRVVNLIWQSIFPLVSLFYSPIYQKFKDFIRTKILLA